MSGVLTVCTANVCRSAAAAAVLTDLLPATIGIGSAGVAARDGQELCPATRQWLTEHDVPAPEHRSRQLTAALVEAADLVLVASRRQRKLVLALSPQAAVFTLREAAYLTERLDPAQPSPDADVAARLREFTHDLTALRHHTRFAEVDGETVTVQPDGGGRRWFGRARPAEEITISPYDVPDAHAAAMHGDHSATFATLEPAVRTIAAGLLGRVGGSGSVPPDPSASRDGRA